MICALIFINKLRNWTQPMVFRIPVFCIGNNENFAHWLSRNKCKKIARWYWWLFPIKFIPLYQPKTVVDLTCIHIKRLQIKHFKLVMTAWLINQLIKIWLGSTYSGTGASGSLSEVSVTITGVARGVSYLTFSICVHDQQYTVRWNILHTVNTYVQSSSFLRRFCVKHRSIIFYLIKYGNEYFKYSFFSIQNLFKYIVCGR